jgi:hypothetical protein
MARLNPRVVEIRGRILQSLDRLAVNRSGFVAMLEACRSRANSILHPCDTIIFQMPNRAHIGTRLLVCFWATLTATSTPAGEELMLSRAYEAQEVQSTIRVQTGDVLVPVTVTDRAGELVWDLTESDFYVFDNGIEQKITHWDSGGMPLTVALVIETSSHNTITAPIIRGIASIFAENILTAEGEGAVIPYSAEVQIRQRRTMSSSKRR